MPGEIITISILSTSVLKELKETQDQLRDILFHLDAQEKLTADNSGVEQQELEDSQISVGAAAKPTTRRLKKKR